MSWIFFAVDMSGLVGQVHRRGISVVIGLHAAERTASSMLWGKLCDMIFSTVGNKLHKVQLSGVGLFQKAT